MNVSQQQQITQQSQIRRQLRERKQLTQNQLGEDIKPFRRYKRSYEAENEGKENHRDGDQSNFRLKRQYPTYDASGKNQSSPSKQTKYKYDLSGKGDPNKLTGNYLSHSIPENNFDNEPAPQMKQSSIRKNYKRPQVSLGLVNNNDRKQVESIIFDSNVRKTEKIDNFEDKNIRKFPVVQQLISDRNLSMFQEKANRVNEQIEAGLTNLQRMIEQLKRKKGQQSQAQIRQKAEERVQNLERQFAERRAEARQRQINEQQIQKLHKIAKSESNFRNSVETSTQDKVLNLIKKQKQVLYQISKGDSPMKELEDAVADSHIQLQGDFKFKANNFPREYTTLINRLSRQIEKDIEFTNKINDLTKTGIIEPVTTLILSEISKHKSPEFIIDETFFRIQPSEMDPLQQGRAGWYKKYTEEELEAEGMKVYQLYKDIQTHFRMKLFGKFSSDIIDLLFEELTRFNFTKDSFNDSSSVTVGHLLSYLNMRTNKSFRNRSFVKLLKRLQLKPNSYLNADALRKLME